MSSQNGKVTLESLDSGTSLSDLDELGEGFGRLEGLAGLDALDGDAGHNPDDPIADLDTSGMTNEEATTRETSAVLAAFIARSKAEQERFAIVTDSEYWVGLCFQTREQKDHFLREAKLLQAGDKYIDGALLAKRMGITLPTADVPYNVSAKVDPKYAALVKDL